MDKPSDFLYFVILTCLMLDIINGFVKSIVLWEAFSTALTHLWAQYNRQVTVSFFFGIRFPAAYLSLVLLGYSFISGGDFIGVIMGIVVGHTYWFLREVWSRRNPNILRWLQAPSWLDLMVNSGRLGKSEEKREIVKSSSGYSVYIPKERSQQQEKETKQQGFSSFSGKGNRIGNE